MEFMSKHQEKAERAPKTCTLAFLTSGTQMPVANFMAQLKFFLGGTGHKSWSRTHTYHHHVYSHGESLPSSWCLSCHSNTKRQGKPWEASRDQEKQVAYSNPATTMDPKIQKQSHSSPGDEVTELEESAMHCAKLITLISNKSQILFDAETEAQR